MKRGTEDEQGGRGKQRRIYGPDGSVLEPTRAPAHHMGPPGGPGSNPAATGSNAILPGGVSGTVGPDGAPAGASYDPRAEHEARLRSMIVHIGDRSGNAVNQDLQELADGVGRELGEHGDMILDLILTCVVRLPSKTPLHAALVGLINLKDPDFVVTLLDDTARRFQAALDAASWMEAKLLLRFFAGLASCNVLTHKALLEFLSSLLGAGGVSVSDMGDGVKPSLEMLQSQPGGLARAEAYVWLVVVTLPWIADDLNQHASADFLLLVETLAAYMDSRPDKEQSPVLDPFPGAPASLKSKDELRKLWNAISVGRTASPPRWEVVEGIHKPSKQLEVQLSAALTHEVPPISLAEHEEGSTVDYPDLSPKLILWPVDSGDKEEEDGGAEAGGAAGGPGQGVAPESMTLMERWVVRDVLSDTLDVFQGSVKECVRQLLQMPVSLPYDDLIVETIFGAMFHLPKPASPTVFHAAVFALLCRNNTTAKVLADSISKLFDLVPHMDIEIADRFSEWFAFNLSQFEYKWKWSEWEEHIPKPDESASLSPQANWIKETLQRMLRLSYREKLVQTTSDAYTPLLPAETDAEFPYLGDNGGVEGTAARGFLRALREKIQIPPGPDEPPNARPRMRPRFDPPELVELVKKDLPNADDEEALVRVVFNTLLEHGNKSLSHTTVALERFKDPYLKRWGKDHGGLILSTLHSYWRNSQANLIFVVDKLLSMTLVDSGAIVKWLFQNSDEEPALASEWGREVLAGVINKTLLRTSIVKEDLAIAESVPEAQLAENEGLQARIVKIRAALADLERREKSLFLDIYQRFLSLLSRAEDKALPKPIWDRVAGSFRSVSRSYREETVNFLPGIEALVLADVEPEVMAIVK